MAEQWVWISGWGIDPAEFERVVSECLPQYSHRAFAPGPDAIGKVLATGARRIGGYSLGALLVLESHDRLPMDAQLTLLAPFLAFCKEAGMGGSTPVASLRAISERFASKPMQALKLFYRLAGLTPAHPLKLPYSSNDLEWGLDKLENTSIDSKIPENATMVWGSDDPLIDSSRLRTCSPKCLVLPGEGHGFRQLAIAVESQQHTPRV